jgi:ribosomal protein S24E
VKANTPLRGGQDSPLSRLKLLEPSERAEIFDWRHTESPTPTNTEIRQRIAERFGIKLSRDGQLSLFWPWQRRQAQMDYYNETIAQDEAALAKKYPGVSREKIREKAIQRLYAAAELEDDAQFGLKVIGVDLKDERASFDKQKYQDSLKSKLQLALDELAEAFKKSAPAMKLYQQARAMIEKTTG